MSTARTHTEAVHPDAATLAAFTDGRLPRVEHAQVVQHLADCQDCFEVVAETAEVLEELDEEETVPVGAFNSGPGPDDVPDNVVVHPRAWRRWAPAAALAATVAVAAVGVWQLAAEPDLSVTRLAAQLEDAPDRLSEDTWGNHGLPDFRSLSFTPSEKQGAFQAGLFVVDLQVALRAGSRGRAQAAAEDLGWVLGNLRGASPLEPQYDTEVLEPLEAGAPLAEIEDDAAELATRLGAPLMSQVHFDLGKWSEAGRLASRVGDARTLRSRSFRRALDELLQEDLPEDVTDKLLDIRERLNGEMDEETLKVLAGDFWVLQDGEGLRVRDLGPE